MKILRYILISMILLGCSPSQTRLQKFAEHFVKERQERWKSRAEHVSSVTLGTREDDVLKYLGKPDSESNSDTTKNWLYWISASIKDGQIYQEAFFLKIEGGAVVDQKQQTGFRQNIVDVYNKQLK